MEKRTKPLAFVGLALLAVAALVAVFFWAPWGPGRSKEPKVRAGMSTRDYIAGIILKRGADGLLESRSGRMVERKDSAASASNEKSRPSGAVAGEESLSEDSVGALGLGAGAPSGSYGKRKGDGTSVPSSAAPDPAKRPASGESTPGNPEKKTSDPEIFARTLTAGSFDDTRDFAAYCKMLSEAGNAKDLVELVSSHGALLLTVKVVGPDGRPLGNCRVSVDLGGRKVEAVSRSDGRAIFVGARDGLAGIAEASVTAYTQDGWFSASRKISLNGSVIEAELSVGEASVGGLPDSLDLAFVVDCTGSMADELEYLKVEMTAIAAAIAERYPYVRQRYALVVYRDQGDEYVTRRFDFNESLDEFISDISAQRAAGGNDAPEAVHEALEEACALSWSGGNAARVLFHIADAPPHDEFVAQTLSALTVLRQKGVAVYPVAGSGVDKTAEFTMRTCALLTGGRYIFLTDHSGVGGTHAEPNVPGYKVEYLVDLMIRMIASEIAGEPIEAQEIIEEK
ncbi:MAG: VWA domain-containing protein [Candidatus Brocadiia bacterium]